MRTLATYKSQHLICFSRIYLIYSQDWAKDKSADIEIEVNIEKTKKNLEIEFDHDDIKTAEKYNTKKPLELQNSLNGQVNGGFDSDVISNTKF